MMKRRLLSLTMALALCLGLLPTTAFAAGGDKAIMLGTSGISGYDSAAGYDYIYFGDWNASNSSAPSGPIKWRVLDEQTNTQNEGLFLLSDVLLGTGTYGGVDFDSTSPYGNAWQGSDAQYWCKTFYSDSLTTQEQSAVLETTKSDTAFASSTYSVPFAASENILNGDKVFFLSAEEAENSAYGFQNDTARIANYGNSAGVWWLRSPHAYSTDRAGAVRAYGSVGLYSVYYVWAARPAFNLNLNSVLFTSAAEGGKSTAAASGGNQGGEAADAIFKIDDYDGSEWKLTLLDSSRQFSVTEETASGKPGDTITLNYTGATVYNADTAPNEYISVIIADDSGAHYYGRITQPTSAEGQVEITIPTSLVDGTYTLNVFSEQYNGGANDDTKLTDYASAFETVSLTVSNDTTAPTLSNGSATRDSDTTATVKFTSDEAGTCYYIAQDTEITLTNEEIAAQDTKQACKAGENEIELDSITANTQYVAVVVQDAAGNISDVLKISIPAYIAPVYAISADTESWDFGTVTEGYTQTPAAKTVTITNTGNQNVTVNLPTSTNYIITAGTGFTSGNAALSPDGEAQFTVQPKTGLGVGTYQETLEMTGTYSVSDDVELHFVVEQRPTGGGGSSRPTPTISQQIITKIKTAQDGDVVTADLPAGKTVLDKEVFEELAGRDVTLVLNLEEEVSWSIYGLDVPETGNFADTDMGVSMNAGSVPVDIINAITGEVDTMQMTLAHDGEFGFTLTLTAPLGSKNAGYWANLYYYDEDAESLTFQTSAQIGEDGTAALRFTHASQYVIIIDDRDHTPKEFPFVDVEESDWYYEAVDYVFQRDLMNGTDSTHFTPDGTSSRAMVATILWRMAGEPQVNYAMDFADVSSGTWYTEAVRWAASEGIVTGYSDTKFGPDDPVTREQFAVMLYRYAQTLGEGFTGSWSFPLNFPDAAEVSDYAYEALCWMTMENVIQGMEDGGLHPQGTANRAQLATMLMRFCQSVDL